MRNVFQFLLLVSLVWFSSCKKEESASGIEGEWSVKSVVCANCKSESSDGIDVITYNYTLTGKDITSKVILKDGKMTSTGSYTAVLQGDLDGLPYFQEVPLNNFEVTGTYVRNGNQLMVTNSNGDVTNSTISDETSDAFTLTYVHDHTQSQQGFVTRVTGTYVYKLERL